MTTPSSSSVRDARRDRARGDAADIGVVAAAADEELDSCPPASNTGVITVMSGRWVPPL